LITAIKPLPLEKIKFQKDNVIIETRKEAIKKAIDRIEEKFEK